MSDENNSNNKHVVGTKKDLGLDTISYHNTFRVEILSWREPGPNQAKPGPALGIKTGPNR